MQKHWAIAVMMAAHSAAAQSADHRADATYKQLEVFARVLSYVDANYVDAVDDQQLMYGAIKGMLDTLDPHTQFYPPQVLAQLSALKLAEPGIELGRKGAALVVVSVMHDSPAQRAGVAAGDEVRAIDHEPTAGMDNARALVRLLGPRGSKLTLTILRDGFRAERDLTIVREQLAPLAVTSSLHEGLGVVRVASFREKTDAAVGRELAQLRALNKGPLSGLVLDLRDNPGGLVHEAVALADRFLPGNLTIVTTRGKNGHIFSEDRSKNADTEAPYPLVVLVNEGSASASEILAGALKDHRRAALLGLPTFGKGSVQTTIQMDDGSGLKLTVARYFTPSGVSIQETGIVPDFVVPPVEGGPLTNASQVREKDLGRHLRNERPAPASALVETLPPRLATGPQVDGDYQLTVALQYLAWSLAHPAK